MDTDQQLLREILATQREMLGEIKAMRRLLEQNGRNASSVASTGMEPAAESVQNVLRKKVVKPVDASGGDELVKALVKRNRAAQDALSFAQRTKK